MDELTLNDYQKGADKTAVFPRLFTEGQVREIVQYVMRSQVLEFWDFQIDGATSEAMNAVTTPFNNLVYPILGLVGEAGELANKLKKIARDKDGVMTPEDQLTLADELGDNLWYDAAVATGLDVGLSEVADANLTKLASRAERGVIQGSGDNR